MTHSDIPQQTLKQWRDAQGWTQFDLAVKSGVSMSTIVNIEHNRQIPSVIIAHKLARALGVTSEAIEWPTPEVLVRRGTAKKRAA